jgi:hypothetical protein
MVSKKKRGHLAPLQWLEAVLIKADARHSANQRWMLTGTLAADLSGAVALPSAPNGCAAPF